MSKKTIRNRWVQWLGAVAGCAVISIAGCATKDGEGSESHFLCTVDSDCKPAGPNYLCVEQKCRFDANYCPQSLYEPDGGFGPSPSPLGFVDGGIYGCYPPREPAPSGWLTTPTDDACPGASNNCTYLPTHLPCGACGTEGAICQMGVVAACDCGHGPFLDQYWDQWVCKCGGGQWDCRITAPSGASCQVCADGCFQETRSTAYAPGMVVTGSAGVTVALTSTPAPPSLGDNTWIFSVKDSGGSLVPGATITVRQVDVDHGHAGAKQIVVTDLGGGSYQAAPVNFNMSGYWETTLHIQKGPIDDEVVIKLCVQ